MNTQQLHNKHFRKLLLIACLYFAAAQVTLAATHASEAITEEVQQTRTVKGRITDSEAVPLSGVTIRIKGNTTGTISDSNGNYVVDDVKKGQELIFSFVGMSSKTVTVGTATLINIVLEEESTLLNEVVAIGYGIQQKKDITGSVSSVKSDNFNQGVVSTPEELIQGKVSGVTITSTSGAPGSGQRIIIRGQGSLRVNTGPLFVIDGFPVGLGGTGSDDTNPFGFINPDDIESIDVLKDASAAAIYGTRGANGVILITTKSGKSGMSRLTVNSKVGLSSISRKIPVFSAGEFRKNVVAIGGNLIDRGGNTDWQNELTTTAVTNDHTVTLQGGTASSTYRASAGYLNQQGIILNTGIERYTANLKATQQLLDGKVKVDFGLNASVEKGDNSNASSLVSDMLWFNPTYAAHETNGSPVNYPDFTNPLIAAKLYTTFSEKRRLSANLSPTIELLKALTYKLNFVYENTSAQYDEQGMPSVTPFEEGYLNQQFNNGYNTLLENYLTYAVKNERHNLSVMAGHSYQETFGRYSHWTIKKFQPTGIEPRFNPGLGQTLTNSEMPYGGAGIDKLQSFFGRVNYSLMDKYLLTATLRADGSSKFGSNNRYGVFPSFAAGWRISEEAFLKDLPLLNNLKLRAGWGQTGNQEIPSKITQASFTTSVGSKSSYPLNNSDSFYAGTSYTRVANPDIQWEVTTQSNVGLDFGFFNGSLSGSVDYFHKVSNNILLEVSNDDPIQVAPTIWTNIKDMTISNNGLELSLDFKRNIAGNFRYATGGTMAYINNKVENSPYTILTTGSASGSGLTGATINGLINGYPVGSFYMKTFTGIGSDGLSTYSDDGALTVVGNAIPELTYSFYVTVGYKGVDLSANFNGVAGNEIYNNTAMNKFYKAQLANSSNTTSKAIEYDNESILNAGAVSTRYLEDGSFLRLNNLTLSYTLNTNSSGIGNWVNNLRLSLSAQNLFVLTSYSGFDPEVNQNRSINGFQSFGIDLNGYPKSRTYALGLTFTL